VGGHCIPCDPHYLLWQLRAKRLRTPLIEEAMAGIAGRPNRVVERATEVLAATGRALTGSRVLVHGVAYKPGVADVRESPALEILSRLEGRGAATDYYDSRVPELHIGGVRLQSIERPSGAGHDLVIVHTVHPQDDTSWLQGVSLLLDATYRLGLSQAHLV
jgi:UDP-N-acetyl-D-mannosaminuronate dehydrogenase